MEHAPAGGQRRAPSRRGEGERLRGEILAAAKRMLAETGEVSTLSLRGVAREVGVAATSIYLHFDDIDALVLAVKADLFARLGAALDAAADGLGAPVDRVRARARGYVAFGFANPGHYQVLFTSQTVKGSPRPSRGGAFIGGAEFDALARDVAAVVGEADDAWLLTVHLWSALHGVVALRTFRASFPWPDLDAQVDDLVDRLLRPGTR